MTSANPELQLAEEFVRDTGCNLFLTGKAGTGKTTFLHGVKDTAGKRLIITAPTGVAAINAGGVTLHSFFQLPFGPFLPGREEENRRHRFTSQKINIIKSLDLLVIDEISMVRADLLDGVDSVLRRHRRSELPFGGVQLLLIGDLHQLPPVVKDEEWRLLQQSYDSPYFFSSNALQRSELLTIELKKIYRQEDDRFIAILNQVRNNQLDQTALQTLNDRYRPLLSDDELRGAITLCSHNSGAETINRSRLAGLGGRVYRFSAEVEGEFPEQAYPTEASLELKEGAQVMFVRNDPSPEKRYFNGRIGRLTGIAGETIRVRCSEDDEDITVDPATWENTEYRLDQESMTIAENRIGSFRQYPLKLAWAITIHKSQGLTFDRAIIDAQAAFAHGQVYVALSRCRSLDGMLLSSPLAARAIRCDPTIRRFFAQDRQPPDASLLAKAKIGYQQQLILDCFDFSRLRSLLNRLLFVVRSSSGLLTLTGSLLPGPLQEQIETEICRVGDNFRQQLQGLFPAEELPGENVLIRERLGKASSYFSEKLTSACGDAVVNLTVETDNQEIRKKATAALKLLRQEWAVKLAGVRSSAEGFSPFRYNLALATAMIDHQGGTSRKHSPAAPSYSEADVGHPELFQALKAWRTSTAARENLAPFQVLHQKTLVQIAVNLPDNMPAMKKIRGVGPRLAERYGEELLAVVRDYRAAHHISEVVLPPAPASEPAAPKTPPASADGLASRLASLTLFDQGRTIKEIASSRGLTTATVEKHLADCIEQGEVEVDRLLAPERQKEIEKHLQPGGPSRRIAEIRQALGGDYGYGEIHFAQAHQRFKERHDPSAE
jgi:hypothetical protein